MFPRGHSRGHEKAYASDSLQVSPKRQELQKKRSNSLVESLCRKLQELEDPPPEDLSLVKSTSTAPAGSQEGSAADDDASGTKNDAQERSELPRQGSGNIVEHILKELKGINKIQEEISDLRQYLTSVSGSVDEVSCCVDAVLSEIGELYCGAPPTPHPTPVLQTTRIRRGSLGRQNAIVCLNERDQSPLLDNREFGKDSTTSKRSPVPWQDLKETLAAVHQIGYDKSEQSLNTEFSSLNLHCRQNCQSTSSSSSCHSSNCPEEGFLSGDTQCNLWHRREQGWSEEDIFSFPKSSRELENDRDAWKKESQSGTVGTSPDTRSEHLSLLFGQQYDSSSSSSCRVVQGTLTKEDEEGNLECDCAANCPFSRSSGYHTTDACADDLDSEPSRSFSCSTVLLTDCDDTQHSPCEDYPSSADTLDLGSTESLDREWTDQSVSREEVQESLSRASSEMDSMTPPQTPNGGFHETIFSEAVVTFRSALKGAMKKLEVSNYEGVKDDADTISRLPPSTLTQSSKSTQRQSSAEGKEKDVYQAANATLFTPPVGNGGTSQTHKNTSSSPNKLPIYQNHKFYTPNKCNSAEFPQATDEKPSNEESSSFELTPNHSPAVRAKCALDPISENCPHSEGDQGKPADAGHRERIANFQRILREKRRTHQRLSRSTQGSQGSYGSQGSQGSQSQEEFGPEFGREEYQNYDQESADCSSGAISGSLD